MKAVAIHLKNNLTSTQFITTKRLTIISELKVAEKVLSHAPTSMQDRP